MLFTNCLNEYKNEKGFRIIDTKAMNENGMVTLYIDFE